MKKKEAAGKFLKWADGLKDVSENSFARRKDGEKVKVHELAHGAAVGLTLAAAVLLDGMIPDDEDVNEIVVDTALTYEEYLRRIAREGDRDE